MSLNHDIESYIALKRRPGLKYVKHEQTLRSYTKFATARGERFLHSDTIIEWASNSASSTSSRIKLRMVRNVAITLHAQDNRHQIPPRGVFGKEQKIRPLPYLMKPDQIRRLMDAALSLPPVGSMTRWTWHYLFGLMAVTGIRQTKFRKSRLVALHSSVSSALADYIAIRKRARIQSDYLFVLSTGRPPLLDCATQVFSRLARESGLLGTSSQRGPRLHDLKHYLHFLTICSSTTKGLFLLQMRELAAT